MKYRELSKFQIKAEISLILQKLSSIDELSREQQLKYIAKLGLIKDSEYVIEVLLKELSKVNYNKGQVIALFLQELATLEQISETLWSYIKSPDSSDELKDISGIILKNLGDNTDPEEFLNYLENPRAIVDKETQQLLEVASVNPEAQIDFLDFLFSLPENEQINLINSLKQDYSSESIVNVATPALESRLIKHMDELLIEILGETKSPKAMPVLNDLMKYSEDEKIKKKAKISLNLLKLSGVNLKNIENSDTQEKITKISDIYEFHTNVPDGLGNQAIIASRKRPNGDILMMNVVINDIHGILDCFGFYGISKNDFKRILEKFQEKNTRFMINPSYCKYILEKAEKINKINDFPIPYEYIAWKSILSDIDRVDYNIEEKTKSWADEKFITESPLLNKFQDFEHWFFEDEDNEIIRNTLEKIITEIKEKKEFYIKNNEEFKKKIETEIDNLIPIVFSPEIRQVYKYRLQNIACIFDIQELIHFRNISASLAWAIDAENDFEVEKNFFFREIIKRTIIEGMLRYQYNLSNEEQNSSNPWNLRKKGGKEKDNKLNFKDQSIEDIIEILN